MRTRPRARADVFRPRARRRRASSGTVRDALRLAQRRPRKTADVFRKTREGARTRDYSAITGQRALVDDSEDVFSTSRCANGRRAPARCRAPRVRLMETWNHAGLRDASTSESPISRTLTSRRLFVPRMSFFDARACIGRSLETTLKNEDSDFGTLYARDEDNLRKIPRRT